MPIGVNSRCRLKAPVARRRGVAAGDDRRDVAPRQATLRATLDWNHDLLPEPERELFARLSVFRGGFTVAGAAAVADGDDLTTLDLLARLVDKSLVQARTDGAEERYRLLEVVRQYAAERLGDRRCPRCTPRSCWARWKRRRPG